METVEETGNWEEFLIQSKVLVRDALKGCRMAHRQPQKGPIWMEVLVILENPFLRSYCHAPAWQKAMKYLAGTYN